jgi:hypothetical protein
MEPPNYIILDAALMDESLEMANSLNQENLCLFSGKKEEYLKGVSPYLYSFTKNSEFELWYSSKGWGHSWGILITTNILFAELYKHFRKLIIVKTDDASELYFRFYDPRVLRVFLPTCYQDQLIEFFGPVEKFICEDENPDFALIFSIQNGKLKTDKMFTSEVMNRTNLEKKEGQIEPSDATTEAPKRKWRFIVE